MKTYKVNRVDINQISLNGRGDHHVWSRADVLKDFSSPWHFEEIEDIEFRALHDGENVFVTYRVYDVSLHIDSKDNSKKSVDNSDRVELFMRRDAQLNPYYCLEIDPLGRVQDFMARPNREFDFNWNWPKEDLEIKSHIGTGWFTVELRLTLASLKRYDLIKNSCIEAGIYRAKYHQLANGQFEPTWITWVDPKTEMPEFHIASSFGTLILQDVNG